jgi:hypothetical protein
VGYQAQNSIMDLLKEKLAVKLEKLVTKINTSMKTQVTFLTFVFCGIIISCSMMKLPNKIIVAERMENGTYKEKEIVNQDSIKQIIKLLNQRSREDRIKFYMQYNLELSYNNRKVSYSIGGKYMKSVDGKSYQLTQPDSLLKMLTISK